MDPNRGFAPGMTLGTHRLERLLGRGGMGTVFKGKDGWWDLHVRGGSSGQRL
jgi:hypothetical protein